MSTSTPLFPLHGSCACDLVRYTLHTSPLIIQCCHCTECQAQTGSAFAINGLVEHYNVTHTSTEPELHHLPAANGKGQTVARCAECKTAIWSNYPDNGELVRFVRMGTLKKDPSGYDHSWGHLEPDVHIYTKTKVPWVIIPEGKRTFEELYDVQSVWSPDSLERLTRLRSE